MKKFLLLILFSFLILQSLELDPNKKRELKELRKLEMDLDAVDDVHRAHITDIKDQLTKEKKIKPTLLGFGDFYQKKTDKGKNNIKFNIYFKNVGKNPLKIFLKYLFFTINLNKAKIRMLEEDNNKKRTLRAILNNDTITKDIVQYQVDNEITEENYFPDVSKNAEYGEMDNIEQYDTIEIEGNFQFLEQGDFLPNAKEEFKNSLKNGENAVYVQDKEDLNNLQDKIFKDNFLFFKVYDLTQLGYLYYKIKGFFDRDMPFQKEKLNFSYIQYYEKKYFEGELEKIPDLKDIHNYNYTLTFRIKDFIDTNLDDGCKANISKYKITNKRMLEGEIIEELILYALDPDLLRLDETSPVMNHNYGRKIASSSGLSGGAIAGIVIACVVAIVGIALAFIYFKRPNIKPADVSAIEFYNNSNVNSSVQVIQN